MPNFLLTRIILLCKVIATSWYNEELSKPERGVYSFMYKMSITNNSEKSVRLVTRQWGLDLVGALSKDGEAGKSLGVVGEMPIIQPGGTFEYTSFAPLKVHPHSHGVAGRMQGVYHLEVSILTPHFSLLLRALATMLEVKAESRWLSNNLRF
ncbi:unnamed protein product [Choristocarpus tenellus]